jgi:hypothetical protein
MEVFHATNEIELSATREGNLGAAARADGGAGEEPRRSSDAGASMTPYKGFASSGPGITCGSVSAPTVAPGVGGMDRVAGLRST